MNSIKDPYKKGEDFWYPLDNAAKIFPAIRSKEHTIVFRIAAVLKERIKIAHLLAAIHAIEDRFPYYKVKLRKGFFWYYLEHLNVPITLEVDNSRLCREFNTKDTNKLLFRILAINNRISIEFSHVLTDGAGAFAFLKTLLVLYFKQEGTVIPDDLKYHHPDSLVSKEEFEDSYNYYFKDDVPPNLKLPKACHLPFPLATAPRFDVLIAILSVNEIKKKADEKGVNINVYLIALYLFVLQDIFKDLKLFGHNKKCQRLRIQVPVNLRNIYPSQSMRNFSLFIMPEIDLRLGYFTFDEIVKIVYHKMQLETDKKLINKIIARNVGSEKKLFVRGIPLFLKSIILYYKYYSMGANQYSGVVTNFGKAHISPEIDNKIEYFIFTPPPPNKKLKINCGAIGFNDNLVLSFGNITKTKELEKKFLHFLVQQGIRVRITKY
ncbi:MAG: hypothetical protein JW973_08965 [Bacteroidales bacterium]|nr:hypothetical protein [Bacteroidales bacterium]